MQRGGVLFNFINLGDHAQWDQFTKKSLESFQYDLNNRQKKTSHVSKVHKCPPPFALCPYGKNYFQMLNQTYYIFWSKALPQGKA